MVRRLFVLIAASLTLLVLPGSTPMASADADVCAGHGTAVTGDTLQPLGPDVTTYFSAALVIGGCAITGQQTWIGGTVTGSCAQWSGSGQVLGHDFTFTGAGLTMVLQGEVTGTVKFYTDSITTTCPYELMPRSFRMAAALVFSD